MDESRVFIDPIYEVRAGVRVGLEGRFPHTQWYTTLGSRALDVVSLTYVVQTWKYGDEDDEEDEDELDSDTEDPSRSISVSGAEQY